MLIKFDIAVMEDREMEGVTREAPLSVGIYHIPLEEKDKIVSTSVQLNCLVGMPDRRTLRKARRSLRRQKTLEEDRRPLKKMEDP